MTSCLKEGNRKDGKIIKLNLRYRKKTFKLAVTRAKLAHTDLNAKLPHNSTLPWLSITLASNATAQDSVTNPDFQIRNQKPTSLMTPWTRVLQNPAASWSFPGYHQPHLWLSRSVTLRYLLKRVHLACPWPSGHPEKVLGETLLRCPSSKATHVPEQEATSLNVKRF